MLPLELDLRTPKRTLIEFKEITIRVLNHLPNVLTGFKVKNNYKLHISNSAGLTKSLRPINQILFIYKPDDFSTKFDELFLLLPTLKANGSSCTTRELFLIDSVLYTIQQAIGCGFDLLSTPNSSRKHVGNRFEELIKSVFNEIKISNKRQVLSIPYFTDEGNKVYKCENDLILSPFDKVKSSNSHLDIDEIVVSVKTTSKDRMGKMFIDKILLEKFVSHNQKVIGIFLNDVQRKKDDNISFTLVSNLFMVYTQFLTELEGVYYLDPPPNALIPPFNKHMAPFSRLVAIDIWKILSS
ncbi:hypothetical protein SAMN03080594_101539 [Arenibacter palladensis]|uniref:Uncharacterized protein n=1 Tax=Arenibacter palladensis TaxID=237373 RepID=A0A1M4U9Q8_9FLAO|nr:hypothetical protein [Arenibacter palladensis]SHE53300.1 hypothetical protein SAMN03080594_101539 [Arenibacter palladensis]